MTASTPRRSRSACHSGTGSAPAYRTARAASVSSSDPGNVTTPIRTSRSLPCADSELFDHRVGQQLAGELLDRGERGAVRRTVDLELEPFSLANRGHAAEAQAVARAEHRLALRVVNLGLEHYVDDHTCHVSSQGKQGIYRQ